MSQQIQARVATENAEARLRHVVVVANSLLRHAQQVRARRGLLGLAPAPAKYVAKRGATAKSADRERAILQRPHSFYFDGDLRDDCARVDEELRSAVREADAAIVAAAPEFDVATLPEEKRTSHRIRRRLRALLACSPSPDVAGWAQFAEPSVRQRIDEAVGRIVADISDLQLIATTPIDTASKTRPISGKRKRQVTGKPPLPQGPKLTKVDQAICLLNTPGHTWTVAELARHVGCAKQTLHGSGKFNRAWDGQQALAYVARGIKHDGQVEAVDEQGLTAEDET